MAAAVCLRIGGEGGNLSPHTDRLPDPIVAQEAVHVVHVAAESGERRWLGVQAGRSVMEQRQLLDQGALGAQSQDGDRCELLKLIGIESGFHGGSRQIRAHLATLMGLRPAADAHLEPHAGRKSRLIGISRRVLVHHVALDATSGAGQPRLQPKVRPSTGPPRP